MKLSTGQMTFTATSGNICRFQIEEKENRVGVIATWKHKPIEADLNEILVHFSRMPEMANADFAYSLQGGKNDNGKAKSVMAVKRFLETGDPGVEQKHFKGDVEST